MTRPNPLYPARRQGAQPGHGLEDPQSWCAADGPERRRDEGHLSPRGGGVRHVPRELFGRGDPATRAVGKRLQEDIRARGTDQGQGHGRAHGQGGLPADVEVSGRKWLILAAAHSGGAPRESRSQGKL